MVGGAILFGLGLALELDAQAGVAQAAEVHSDSARPDLC